MIIKCTHELLFYVDVFNTLDGSVRIEENTEALVVASKENGLEGNADNTKYLVMPEDQNAGRSHNMQSDNRSFERVEEFKYLEQP